MKPFKSANSANSVEKDNRPVVPKMTASPQLNMPPTSIAPMNGANQAPSPMPKFVTPKGSANKPFEAKTSDDMALKKAILMSEEAKTEVENAKKGTGASFAASTEPWTPPKTAAAVPPAQPWATKKPEMKRLDADSVLSAAPKQPSTPNMGAAKQPWTSEKSEMETLDADIIKSATPQQPWASNKAAQGPVIKTPFAPKNAADLKQAIGLPNITAAAKQPWASKKPDMKTLDAGSVKSATPQQPWVLNKAGPAIKTPFAPKSSADLKRGVGVPAMKQPWASKKGGPAKDALKPTNGADKQPWVPNKQPTTVAMSAPSTPRTLWQKVTQQKPSQDENTAQ